jgi:hypothetical protein
MKQPSARRSSQRPKNLLPGARPATDQHRSGDKLRIKTGTYAGQRAVLLRTGPDVLVVLLPNGDRVMLPARSVTNFSLAARKAWVVMPKRAGRPKLDKPHKKMVSLRLDLDVAMLFDRAARLGLVKNRSEALNAWARDRLTGLLRAQGLADSLGWLANHELSTGADRPS